jgi:hypothetical protein
MIYKILKVRGKIGTVMEKINLPLDEIKESVEPAGNRISLATFDDETNTIQIINDEIIDVSTITQKFTYHCNLPNNHKFSILSK